MKFKSQNKNLIKSLNELNHKAIGIINRCNQSIILCRNLLNDFKKHVLKTSFNSLNDEVEFFKIIKQIPLTQLIYFSEVRSFEIQFPKVDSQKQRKYVKKKLHKLNRFFLYNMDFGQYIESEQTHLDEQYFTRSFFDNLPITSSKFYFQDPEFSTPYDMLLGKYKAYSLFIKYLEKRLVNKRKSSSIDNSFEIKNQPELLWTSSKTALTELIYALHSNRVINNGNTDIKEIANTLQRALNFDLGDFYKTFSEIKSRKISRTKFLDDLSASLITQMDKSEN